MLTIEHLSVDYYRRGQVISAVRDFSLAMNAGETVGLVGESGSGKSTAALAILRLIRSQEGRITSGRIIFDEKDLLLSSEQQMRAIRGNRISMIFQDPFTSLNPVMTIKDQMKEVLTAHPDIVGAGLRARPQSATRPQSDSDSMELNSNVGQARRPAPTVLEDALSRVQLDPGRVLNAYPHQLSGGQRQRVMIAMAILNRPQILLADEPTTALDTLVQKQILDLLFRLQKELNMGILLVSHNLALVAQYTQKILVMKAGTIVEEGTSSELFRHPAHPYTQALMAALHRLS